METLTPIRVSIVLPYLLRLPSGSYPFSTQGKSLDLREQVVLDANGYEAKRTAVSLTFEASLPAESEANFALKQRQFRSLLEQTNRLIRWDRTETRLASVVEITRVQASPFVFAVEKNGLPWGDPLIFEADPPALSTPRSRASISKSVRAGMADGRDPEVASLFLLDAEQARRDGRFREAVLFCWSTIDATFNTKYETLVDEVLIGEWGKGRDAVKDNRFGMKNKMSAVLFLITGRSFFREPNNFWDDLAKSYSKRNEIIHSGGTAQEADAELALSVAHQVVKVMASAKPKKIKQTV